MNPDVMSPDVVAGVALVAAGVAGLIAGSAATLLALRGQPAHLVGAVALDAGSHLLPPVPVLPVIDDEHLVPVSDRCDECGASIDQTCPHGRSLCVDDALSCDECLQDLRCQGVLSQYVTGTFVPPTSGGAA